MIWYEKNMIVVKRNQGGSELFGKTDRYGHLDYVMHGMCGSDLQLLVVEL